jgi:hypothetical protein
MPTHTLPERRVLWQRVFLLLAQDAPQLELLRARFDFHAPLAQGKQPADPFCQSHLHGRCTVNGFEQLT